MSIVKHGTGQVLPDQPDPEDQRGDERDAADEGEPRRDDQRDPRRGQG